MAKNKEFETDRKFRRFSRLKHDLQWVKPMEQQRVSTPSDQSFAYITIRGDQIG